MRFSCLIPSPQNLSVMYFSLSEPPADGSTVVSAHYTTKLVATICVLKNCAIHMQNRSLPAELMGLVFLFTFFFQGKTKKQSWNFISYILLLLAE